MNAQVNTQVAATEVEAAKARAAYLVKQDNRVRYSFGKVWNATVLEGKVHDKQKLIAQGVKLKVARSRSDVRKLKFETLLARVQTALKAA